MVSPHRPVTELDKSDVLSGLFASWDTLDRLTTGLTDEQWQLPTPLPDWNVHAVVSHIIGTESVLQGIATPAPNVDVSALEHVRNDSGAMNECWVRHLSGIPSAELRERFLAVTKDRRELLTDMSEDDWNVVTPTPAGPNSSGRFMRIRIFDCWMHEHDIRARLAGRQPTRSSAARIRDWRSTRWRPAWDMSSASSARHLTGRGSSWS